MKRKIQHDAINNQEDEDSSTDRFLNDDTHDKKENEPAENSATPYSSEASNNKDEITK